MKIGVAFDWNVPFKLLYYSLRRLFFKGKKIYVSVRIVQILIYANAMRERKNKTL